MGVKIDPEDIVGRKFGKVIISKYLGYFPRNKGSSRKEHFYECTCACGNTAVAARGQILRGKRKTCGNCTKIIREGGHYRYFTKKGDTFIFGPEDLEFISAHRCSVNEHGYATVVINGKSRRLSSVLLGTTGRQCADHINGDRSDNRRSNLRVCSNTENHGNQCISSRNTSGYKGVSRIKGQNRYRAYINKNGVRRELGNFSTAIEAAGAYDRAARFYFGEFACVNFPKKGEQCCFRNEEPSDSQIAV